jgi:Arc-like DNA binding domain.
MKLRMPPELKEEIEDQSKANGRSMNSEIIHRLESSFEKRSGSNAIISSALARELAEKAKREIENTARQHVIDLIQDVVRRSGNSVHIDFYRALPGIEHSDIEHEPKELSKFDNIFDRVMVEFKELGYKVTCDEHGLYTVEF